MCGATSAPHGTAGFHCPPEPQTKYPADPVWVRRWPPPPAWQLTMHIDSYVAAQTVPGIPGGELGHGPSSVSTGSTFAHKLSICEPIVPACELRSNAARHGPLENWFHAALHSKLHAEGIPVAEAELSPHALLAQQIVLTGTSAAMKLGHWAFPPGSDSSASKRRLRMLPKFATSRWPRGEPWTLCLRPWDATS